MIRVLKGKMLRAAPEGKSENPSSICDILETIELAYMSFTGIDVHTFFKEMETQYGHQYDTYQNVLSLAVLDQESGCFEYLLYSPGAQVRGELRLYYYDGGQVVHLVIFYPNGKCEVHRASERLQHQSIMGLVLNLAAGRL